MNAAHIILLAVLAGTPAEPPDTKTADVLGFFHFSFTNPGARSLRLGGAFNGIADNATAAYSNPAGLTNVSRTELSVEGKHATYTTVYTDRGHGGGEPTGIGLDTIAGIQEGRSDGTVDGASFASVVMPRHDWSWTVYRHELANFRSSFETGGIFVGSDLVRRVSPTKTDIDALLVTYAVGGARRIRNDDRDELSVGVTLGRTSLELSSHTHRFGSPAGPFAPADELQSTNVVRGEGAALNGSIGILWRRKFSNDRSFHLGAVYRHGPGFDVSVETIGAEGSPLEGFRESTSATINVPGIIGTGAALTVKNTTVAIDVNRVGYEQIIEDVANTFDTDNGYEIRAGVEHRWLRRSAGGTPYGIAAGIGGWRDPDHRLAYRNTDDLESLIYRRGDDDYHVTGGLSLFTNAFTLDAAFDYSDRQRIISLSAAMQLTKSARTRRRE